MNAVVAVHVGAGYHSPEKLAVYKRLCHSACRKAISMLERPDCTALEAACSAVVILENDPATNAGYGSNLTVCGNVECDASVMDGKSLKFGAVGALPRVGNPVLVARALCEAQNRGPLSLGRIPPCFLVGEGALRWARSHLQLGMESQSDSSLVTEQAKRCHTKHKKKMRLSEDCQLLEASGSHQSSLSVHQDKRIITDCDVDNLPESQWLDDGDQDLTRHMTSTFHAEDLDVPGGLQAENVDSLDNDADNCSEQNGCLLDAHRDVTPSFHAEELDAQSSLQGEDVGDLDVDGHYSLEQDRCLKLDTVGAVCLDKSGNVAAAVSSGGIWLKHSGRVGQAGVYGCGCWAETAANGSAVAVSTSGGGEHLIKTMLARRCADALLSAEDGATALHDCFRTGFLDSPFLRDVEEKLGGVLALKVDAQNAVCDVLWAHTTRTLCYGYMQSGGTSPKFGCSRLQEGETVGRSVVVGGTPLRLCSPFERDYL